MHLYYVTASFTKPTTAVEEDIDDTHHKENVQAKKLLDDAVTFKNDPAHHQHADKWITDPYKQIQKIKKYDRFLFRFIIIYNLWNYQISVLETTLENSKTLMFVSSYFVRIFLL